MNENRKDKELIKGFFKENLTKNEKEEFLKKASSDKDFVKDFIYDLESEASNCYICEDEEEESSDKPNQPTSR